MQQVHAAVFLILSDSQQVHVVTALWAWLMLEKDHRTEDMANQLGLEEKFASFKYTISSRSGHVMKLEDLVMKIESANCGPSIGVVCAGMCTVCQLAARAWSKRFACQL